MNHAGTVLSDDSGFRRLVGYDVEIGDGCATLRLELGPRHLNRSDVLHGGVIMTLLDAACGYACTGGHDDPDYRGLVTVSMTTNFIGVIDSGLVRVEAKVTGGGRKLVFAEGRVFDAGETLIATGAGTFRRMRGRARTVDRGDTTE